MSRRGRRRATEISERESRQCFQRPLTLQRLALGPSLSRSAGEGRDVCGPSTVYGRGRGPHGVREGIGRDLICAATELTSPRIRGWLRPLGGNPCDKRGKWVRELRAMSVERATGEGIGQPLQRKEDLRLLTGKGHYAADHNLPNMAYAAMVRAPHAHARIRKIETSAAKSRARNHRHLYRRGFRRRWPEAHSAFPILDRSARCRSDHRGEL